MSLAAAGEQVSTPRPGVRCNLSVVWDGLDGEDRATLEGWLRDRANTGTFIAAALEAEGHRVSPQMIGRHRGPIRCGCGVG